MQSPGSDNSDRQLLPVSEDVLVQTWLKSVIVILACFCFAAVAWSQDPAPEPATLEPAETTPPLATSASATLYIISERTLDDASSAAIIDAVSYPLGATDPKLSRLEALSTMPLMVAADPQGLWLVFPQNPGESTHPVRKLLTTELPQGAVAPTRLAPRPPIPSPLIPRSIITSPAGPIILAADPSKGAMRLLLLSRGAWRDIHLAQSPAPSLRASIVWFTDSLIIAEPDEGSISFYTVSQTIEMPPPSIEQPLDPQDSSNEAAAPASSLPITGPTVTLTAELKQEIKHQPVPNGFLRIINNQPAIITIEPLSIQSRTIVAGNLAPPTIIDEGDGFLDVHPLKTATAALKPARPDDSFNASPTDPLPLEITLTNRLGERVYTGTPTPLSLLDIPDLFFFLSFFAATILSMTVVTIHVIIANRLAKPLSTLQHASAASRFIAATIDVIIGLLITAPIFSLPLDWWIAPLSEVASQRNGIPIATAIALTIAITALTELTITTTPGKLLLRLKTVSPEGARPRAWKLVLRATVRVLCPAAFLWIIIRPDEPHPASINTFVVSKPSKASPGSTNQPTHQG